MIRYLPALLAVSSATAQVATYKGVDFSIGAKAGLLLNRGVSNSSIRQSELTSVFRNDTQRPVLGATFEAEFKWRLAVEFSPTFRRSGYTQFTNFSGVARPIPGISPAEFTVSRTTFFRQSTSTWDLPIMGKYYFTKRTSRVRPFFAAGASPSRFANEGESTFTLENGLGERMHRSFEGKNANWAVQPVAAAGFALRSGRFSIVPEFRYMRDNRGRYPGPRDRFEFFLGFRF